MKKKDPMYSKPYIDVDEERRRVLPDGTELPDRYMHGGFEDTFCLTSWRSIRGMIMENIVAQMLAASGHRLYFYSNPSRKDPEARMEIDFLIAKSKVTSRHNISPIEVKSGSNYTLSSLRKFPVYMVPCL